MDHVVWPETMVDNRNQLARPDKNDILKKLSAEQIETLRQIVGELE